MNKNKLIIFDLDGTLFRTETVDVEAFNCALELNGYRTKDKDKILSLIGLPLKDICKTLLETDDSDLVNEFKRDVIKFENDFIATFGQLYCGVEDFLLRLKASDYKLCICSNGNKEYVTAIADKFGFHLIFDEIWHEKDGISKSEAVGMLKDKFGVDGFIMVGDRTADIQAAKDNGGIAIGVTYGFGKNEAEKADYTAKDIVEVEKAICESMSSKPRCESSSR